MKVSTRKTRFNIYWVLSVGLVLSASPAWASDEGSKLTEQLWATGNLALLISILVIYGRRPLQDFLSNRKSEIEKNLNDAAETLDSAERQLREWQERNSQLDEELARIRSTAQARGEAEKVDIINQTEAASARMKENMKLTVNQEIRRAKNELRAEAAELAVELAAKLLSEKVTDDDRSRLVNEFIEGIGNNAGDSAGAQE